MKFFISVNLKEVCSVCRLFITSFNFVALILIHSLIFGLRPRDKVASAARVSQKSRVRIPLDCSQSPIFSRDRLDIQRLTATAILIFKCTEGWTSVIITLGGRGGGTR